MAAPWPWAHQAPEAAAAITFRSRFFLLAPEGRDGPAGFGPGVWAKWGRIRAEDERGVEVFAFCVSLVAQKLPAPSFPGL